MDKLTLAVIAIVLSLAGLALIIVNIFIDSNAIGLSAWTTILMADLIGYTVSRSQRSIALIGMSACFVASYWFNDGRWVVVAMMFAVATFFADDNHRPPRRKIREKVGELVQSLRSPLPALGQS